jgi:hypothetical protein
MRLPSGIQLNENQLEKFKRLKGKIDLEINNEINL